MTAERGPKLKDAAEAWLDGLRAGHICTRSGDPYKPASIRDYERNRRLRIYPVLGDARMADITTRDVQGLVDGLVKEGLASATIDAAVTPLKALFRRAVARGDIKTNPTLGVEKPAVRCAVKAVASPEQVEAMLTVLEPADRALWATAFYAGLRRGELIGLGREDIDLARGVIHVRRSWDVTEGRIVPTKNSKERVVPIPAVLRRHVHRQVLACEDPAHVFGRPQYVARAGRRARETSEAAGLPVVVMHGARHTFASFAIAAGVNIKALSTYMGHATVAITLDTYGHLLPGSEEEAASLLDDYFARPTIAPAIAHG